METTRPASKMAALNTRDAVTFTAAFLAFLLLYLSTAPANHSLSWDSYWFAGVITVDGITEVPQPRLFLWIAAMQALYSAASTVVTDPDPFRLIGFVNAVQAALAVTLFARLLTRDFSVDHRSAWLSAGLLGSSYGLWRYATEIEVYASAALLSVVLLLAAFAVDRDPPIHLGRRVLALACLGGVATLVYQPIGLVAGVAIPFYLLIRLRLAHVALYCAVSGIIVVAGFSAAYQLGGHAPEADAVAFVLDAERIFPRVPDLMTLPKTAYAIGHDLLSTNWMHAIDRFNSVFARIAPGRNFQVEIYAGERAGWIVWVAVLTIPGAAILLATLVWTSVRQPATARFCAREATLVVWLAAHAAMMAVLAPGGAEGWILGLIPLMGIAARRLVMPAVAAGRSARVLLLVAVFLVHNGFAGIGVVAGEEGDYLRARGEPLVEQSGPDDLIVMAHDWKLEGFLRYAGASRTLLINRAGVEDVRRAIDETIAEGDRVLIVDDISSAPARMLAQSPSLVRDRDALLRDYPGAWRIAENDAGSFYEIAKDGGR